MSRLAMEALWALTTVVSITDLRARIIPNIIVGVVLGLAVLGMVAGLLSWWHLAWAAGTWIAYDLQFSLRPGSVAYGDVKWAATIMAVLGLPGLLVLFVAHLTMMVWGTAKWLAQHRTVRWSSISGMPWAPGTWFGVSGLLLFTFVR